MKDAHSSLSPLVDHVIGKFPRERLSAALASVHRAGFGPYARVLDGARTDAASQLERTGLHLADGHRPPADALLIVVTAPGRAQKVADLFAQLGAEATYFATRNRKATAGPVESEAIGPDIRIAGDSALGAER
jgi:hypothetical protein